MRSERSLLSRPESGLGLIWRQHQVLGFEVGTAMILSRTLTVSLVPTLQGLFIACLTPVSSV